MKISINKLHDKRYEPLLRAGEWTTNNYWIVKSQYEPKALQKRATTGDMPLSTIQRLFDHVWHNGTTDKAEISKPFEKDFKTLVKVVTQSKSDAIYCNADYVAFFQSIGCDTFKINTEKRNMPLICIKNNELVGLVQPLNIYM